jgi:hypothetical protein
VFQLSNHSDNFNYYVYYLEVGIDIGFESGSDPAQQWFFRSPSTMFRWTIVEIHTTKA